MPQRTTVLPSVTPLTVEDARELLAPSLIKVCGEHGPTRVGVAIGGADEKTVRDARDEKSSLSLHYAANLLRLDGTAFDPFLACVGRRSVPIDAVCNTDALPAMTGAVHRLVVASSPTSPAGASLHPSELLDAEPQLREAFDAIGGLLNRIDAIRKGDAA